MYSRCCAFLCAALAMAPQWADAQPLLIGAEQSVGPARTDVGDGLCATAVHVKDLGNGSPPFSSVNDALAVLDKGITTLNADARISGSYSLVNFKNDYPLLHCDFPDAVLFPFSDNAGAISQNNDRDFAMRLRGYINIDASAPSQLLRTLGIYADDGARVSIGGSLVTTPDINELISGRRLRQIQYAKSGLYPIEIVYYQNGSAAVLELAESDQQVADGTTTQSLADLGFKLIGEPRGNLFANTELYTSQSGVSSTCTECNDDSDCMSGSYCAKDFGPPPSTGLCQRCGGAKTCGGACGPCTPPPPVGESLTPPGGDQNQEYVGGCHTAANAPIPWRQRWLGLFYAALVIMLLLRRSRQRRRSPSLGMLLFGVILFPSVARAELSANTQTFHPAMGPDSLVTVEGTRTGMQLRPLFNVMLDYSYRPLRLIDTDTGRIIADTVPSITTLHLMAGMGLTRFLSLAVDLPIVVNQGFDRATPLTDVPNAPLTYGLADVRLVSKLRIINNDQGGFGLAFVPQVTFPTGDGTALRGDDAYGIEPRLAMDYRTRHGAIVALNLGFLGRTSNQTVRLQEVGSQIRYGLGAYLPLATGFGVVGELAGGTSITTVAGGNGNSSASASSPSLPPTLDGERATGSGRLYSPLEGMAGLRFASASGFNLNFGGGAGLTPAVGSPEFRLYLGLGYLPLLHKKPTPPPAIPPTIPSAVPPPISPPLKSKPVSPPPPCKQAAAPPAPPAPSPSGTVTIEKVGDGTGAVGSAPEGITCGKACAAKFRLEQEIVLTAVADSDSRFAGWEGACTGVAPCTVLLRADTRLTARFIKKHIEVTAQKLDLTGHSIHFETAKAFIAMDSCSLLDEVVVILKQNPQMRLRIEGHTDSVPFRTPGGNLQLSQARAAAVVKYLVDRGVAASRLSSQGFGDLCPVAENRTAQGRQENRRTEFLIVDPATGAYQRTPCVAWTPPPKLKQLRRQEQAIFGHEMCCAKPTPRPGKFPPSQ